MKKILVLLVLLMLVVGGRAEASFNTEAKLTVGISELALGTYYEWSSEELYIGGAMPVVNYDNLLSLDVGLLTNVSENFIPIGSLSLSVKRLTEIIGWNYILADPFTVGVWYGREFEANKAVINHSGVYATISWKL